jgi:3-oxoacyl-[acyl-carrier-protein] synthase II
LRWRDRSAGERVVVVGRGAVTPLGGTVRSTWEAAEAGRSGIREITRFDARGLPCRIAGEVEDAWLSAVPEGEAWGGRPWQLLATAATEAAAEARVEEVGDRTRIAVILGFHGQTPSHPLIELLARRTDAGGRPDLGGLEADGNYDCSWLMRRRPDHLAALLARRLDARGASMAVVSACAAGAQAVGEAVRLLREGRADLAIAAGAESQITYAGFAGFVLLGALAKRYASPETASRPFDRRRTGFVMSEGAGVFVLETLAHARARGREPLGEILGYGSSADAYRITDMHPEGDGAVAAMEAAIRDAGIRPEEVEYVNAHGTSTPLNDPVETTAIKRVLGARVPVSSNKSMLGHTIGAAGTIEAILALEGIRRGVLLPTINLETPDPRCDLDYVPNEARRRAHRIALSNSFGFGGQNACLVLGAFE